MYPKLASDSSSLILLVKSGTIQYVLKKNVIAIPKSVYEEAVVKGKLKGFEDSYIIEGYVQNSKIKIAESKDKTKDWVEKLCNLHLGERDVIALAIEKKLKVLCDDKKGRNACEVFKLETVTVLNVLNNLFEEKKLSKNKALSILSKLENYGWYKKSLIEYVRNKIKGD